jgi:hypothetical protein
MIKSEQLLVIELDNNLADFILDFWLILNCCSIFCCFQNKDGMGTETVHFQL